LTVETARGLAMRPPVGATLAGALLVVLAAIIARSPHLLWLALGFAVVSGGLAWVVEQAPDPLLRLLALAAGLAYTATLLVGLIFSAGFVLAPSLVLWALPLRHAPWDSEQASLVVGAGLLAGLVIGVIVVALLPGFKPG
jgi:hypothetical protein